MEKEIKVKIDIPQGYEVEFCEEKLKFELRPIPAPKPKSMDELYEILPEENTEYYTQKMGGSPGPCSLPMRVAWEDVFSISNEDELEAALALMELRHLRKAWIGVWKPDYVHSKNNWHIHSIWGKDLTIDRCSNLSRPMSFPTEELAEEFLECHREKLMKAISLL